MRSPIASPTSPPLTSRRFSPSRRRWCCSAPARRSALRRPPCARRWCSAAWGSRPCSWVRHAAHSTFWYRRSGGSPRRCFCASARKREDDRQKTQGEVQPTKQSFEADRLEQLHCSSCFEPLLLLLRLPPPCVFCRLPSALACRR